MNVLVIGKDPSLFSVEKTGDIGDALKRHICYLEVLNKNCLGSEIRILTYTPLGYPKQVCSPVNGLKVYPTNSRYRWTFVLDAIAELSNVITPDWIPDVVTVQEVWEEGVLGLFLSKKYNARFVPQLHFDMFHDSWLKEHWLNHVKKWIARKVFMRAKIIRVVSNPLKIQLANWLNLPKKCIRVVPVGVGLKALTSEIDKNQIKREMFPDLVGRDVVLYVGRLVRQKNLDAFLEVALRVRNLVPNSVFLIVGDGDDRTRIEDLIAENNLETTVKTLGAKEYGELSLYYAIANVFLLMSDYEGFGRVILESYLSSVPVVTTAQSGPEDLIDHGLTGYLVSNRNIDQATEHVKKLLQDPDLAKRMGEAGFKKVVNQYSAEALSQKIVDCWIR